ncbi:hypothetical protein CC1G_12544 [Coprinopsis cinerea okayama7|uniref:Uncharacterized protein n=1 Tax=Coprinopsis cinerea (strain Okayama-7 / 130 / ATCC MYA-4618 / FGSC 9003) TaxID=240176 RepID=A8NGH4_COPC7|nr:hypothetical protein CC1G_12544 [Coprinopsis cinerea okayama7\|eukprot:XP_001833527.2 hypothetical protein CC1G_12544 [Coprinopsis cinerea okayama7\
MVVVVDLVTHLAICLAETLKTIPKASNLSFITFSSSSLRALEKLESQASSTSRLHAPNPFDGSDPELLDTFIAQLTVYLSCYTHIFKHPRDAVATALSYLKGKVYTY